MEDVPTSKPKARKDKNYVQVEKNNIATVVVENQHNIDKGKMPITSIDNVEFNMDGQKQTNRIRE